MLHVTLPPTPLAPAPYFLFPSQSSLALSHCTDIRLWNTELLITSALLIESFTKQLNLETRILRITLSHSLDIYSGLLGLKKFSIPYRVYFTLNFTQSNISIRFSFIFILKVLCFFSHNLRYSFLVKWRIAAWIGTSTAII